MNMLERELWECLIPQSSQSIILPEISELYNETFHCSVINRFRALYTLQIFLRDLRAKVLQPYSCDTNVKEIFLPSILSLSNVLLFNAFPEAKCFFVAEGLPAWEKFDIAIPGHWKLQGLRSPYSPESKPVIYAPQYLNAALSAFGTVKMIQPTAEQQVRESISTWQHFNDLKNEVKLLGKPKCCLLMQDLQKDWMGYDEELTLYTDILATLAREKYRNVFIKPHPRNHQKFIEAVASSAIDCQITPKLLSTDHLLNRLPFHMLMELFSFELIITICSTAILPCIERDEIQTRLYYKNSFSDSLKTQVNRCAKYLGTSPILLGENE
jgi:hypothetical protein